MGNLFNDWQTYRHLNTQGKLVFFFKRPMHGTLVMTKISRVTVSDLFEEIGKFDFQMGRFRFQPVLHLLKNNMKTLDINLTVELIENFNEPAHMRPFELMREIDIHIGSRDCLLLFLRLVADSDWVGDCL